MSICARVVIPASELINILAPSVGVTGCRGDSNYVNGSGTDDSTALQSILDQSVQTGSVSAVQVPAGRTYRLNSTVTVPYGVQSIEGIGGRTDNGVAGGATFVWNGSAGGTMFDVAVAGQNIPSTMFKNVTLLSRTDGTNRCGKLIRYRGTGGNQGAADTGSGLDGVWLMNADRLLSLEGGATNFFIRGGRFDDWSETAIYVGGAGASITIDGNCTFAMGQAADNIIWVDGESPSTLTSIVRLIGLHLETNTSLNQTYSGGTNPFDKRGLIRLGVNASVGSVQHRVHCLGLELAEPFSISSHCVFQITAASTADSDLDNSRMVNITVDGGMGLERGTTNGNTSDETRILGGRVATNERPPVFGTGNFGRFHFGVGKNSTGETIVNWTSSRGDYHRSLVTEARTVAQLVSDFPKSGQRGFVTDSNATLASGHGNVVSSGGSNIVPVYYDGTNWRIG